MTGPIRVINLRGQISTHTPLAGRDPVTNAQAANLVVFLLTRPSRDVTPSCDPWRAKNIFLLTRPSRDVTGISPDYINQMAISTHTPLAGRDNQLSYNLLGEIAISTHTPLAGRDIPPTLMQWYSLVFLLTRPSRDVTRPDRRSGRGPRNFYSHAPRGT